MKNEMHTQPPASSDAVRAVLNLEDRLLEVERRMPGSPYEVLEVEETDDDATILGALAVALGGLEVGPEIQDVPPNLRRRLEKARARLEKAAAFLQDPQARVALDLDIGLGLSEGRTDAEREALRQELAKRRKQVSEEERAAFARARPYVERGTEMLGAGDVKGARTMLRMARMYDPYDMEILDLCAAAHGVVASAESMAMLRGNVMPTPPPVPTSPKPPPSKPQRPRPKRSKPQRSKPSPRAPSSAKRAPVPGPSWWPAARLAGAMLLVMLLTASVAAASVLALPIEDVLSLANVGTTREGPEEPTAAAASEGPDKVLPEWVRLLTRARDAADSGDAAKAHALAAQSYELQATEQALEVMAVSACEMQDPASARASYVKLVGRKARQRVAQLCSRDHIDLRVGVEAATATDLLTQARKASEAGEEAQACRLASQSQALKHSAEALQMMVVCACKGGDAERAKRLADSLADAEREPIRAPCTEQGIDLD